MGECASLDAAILKLESQGALRHVGVQLYWMLKISRVSAPIIAEFAGTSDSTIYRHMQADVVIKSDLHERFVSAIRLLALAVRDDVLPVKDDEGKERQLLGAEGLEEFNALIEPYLVNVRKPVYAMAILKDYADRYERVRGRVVKNLKAAPDPAVDTDSSVDTAPVEDHPPLRESG